MTTAVMDAYTAWLRAGNCGDRTVAARLQAARRLAHVAGGDATKATAVDAVQLIGSVSAPASRATYYAHVASWCRFLTSMDLGGEWIAKVPQPRARRSTPRPLTDAQVASALSVATPRASGMILLGAYQGLRVSEIAAVHGRDVTERTLRVRGKGGANAALPTHPLVWAEAQRHDPDGWWFPALVGNPAPVPADVRRTIVDRLAAGDTGVNLAASLGLSESVVSKWWRAYQAAGDVALQERPAATSSHVGRVVVWSEIKAAFAAAGFPEATPHQLRHWYATTLLRRGANIRVVQELMRHASLATTQVYTKVDDDDCAAAIGLLPDMSAGRA